MAWNLLPVICVYMCVIFNAWVLLLLVFFIYFPWLADENTKEVLQVKKSLSEKVSLYRGDITLLEVDAIVNAGKCLNVSCMTNCDSIKFGVLKFCIG